MKSLIFVCIVLIFSRPCSGYSSFRKKPGRNTHECGKNRLRTVTCPFAAARIPEGGVSVPGQLPRPIVFLLGSVHRHGVCSTQRTGIFARYRGLPFVPSRKALPRRDARKDLPIHSGRHQRETRLPDLRGGGLFAHPNRPPVVPSRRTGRRIGS